MDHERILEAAFADPQNTPIELPPADVNKVIKTSYKVDKPFTYTRTQLWDMERRKAHDPERFLGGVVRPGSVEILDVKREGDVETFARVGDQRRWANPSEYSRVIELVRLDHATQRALFIGVDAMDAPDGRRILRGPEQPRFHVEHSCAGTEEAPLNIWRLVLLDKDESGATREAFRGMMESPYLRAFNEIYIREVLGRELVRKEN
ncbi:hypothetical protein V2A60_009366 [Cordyceps javanica]|uniref:Uncharacterized protein n=1 Tax=Cordyceps javanica TaxID=43265 RepID=A0A545VMV4_9HYPO|nr:hypothetical protein IF1G_10057 [Cordyceps javanica]TQW03031.1 hypothetical protein IF2G_09548 [Cordyceps javanica]